MRRSNSIIFILLVLTSTLPAGIQDISFEHITVEQGLSDSGITCILQDRYGFMWFGTLRGLNRYDGYNCKIYTHEPGNPGSIGDNVITSICEDQSGSLWVGTRNGINKFDRGKNVFIHFKHVPDNPDTLRHNYITSVCEAPSGSIWVATRGGLHKFDPAKEIFTRFINNPGKSDSRIANFINAMCIDRSGDLWIGTPGATERFSPKERIFRELLNEGTKTLFKDKAGVVWLGTFSGLMKYDREKDIISSYNKHRLDAEEKPDVVITSILEDKSGLLWVGDKNGIEIIDRQANSSTFYRREEGNPKSLSSNIVTAIYEDRSGIIWVGTKAGINKISMHKKKFDHYRHNPADSRSLSNNDVWAFHEDRSGTLWIGTENGLNGFNAFYPEDIKDNPFIPPVVITSFEVFNREFTLEKSILETEELKLTYFDSFSFEFAALCFADPERNQYCYMLEGIHDDWVNLGNKNEINFANLPPGKYTLRIKGSNEDGVWNEEGTSIRLIITPPFYRTWWFKSIIILLIICLFVSLYITGMHRQAKKLKTELALEKYFSKYNISEREREIIFLVLEGKSNKEIEDTLYISIGTVKNHIYSVYRKLKIKNRTQLVNLFKHI